MYSEFQGLVTVLVLGQSGRKYGEQDTDEVRAHYSLTSNIVTTVNAVVTMQIPCGGVFEYNQDTQASKSSGCPHS